MQYNLSHLTQKHGEVPMGPIQDDEALLLYALCRVIGIRNVLEFGVGKGDSARNFIAAGCTVWSVDVNPIAPLGEYHRMIHKSAEDVTPEDIQFQHIDLLFFDCHVMGQLDCLATLKEQISDRTIIALHDTGTHATQLCSWATESRDGWIHQPVEREMVPILQDMGYVPFHAHGWLDRVPYRHGLTIVQKPVNMFP